jgi:hypothetical protein
MSLAGNCNEGRLGIGLTITGLTGPTDGGSELTEGLISPIADGGHRRCVLFENDHLG